MRKVRVVALIALMFLGVSSLMGGIPLVLDPSGGILHMPLSLLERSPFRNFLIPGIILLVANGLLSLAIFVAVSRRAPGYGMLVAFQGCVIGGWITVEVFFLQSAVWPHYVYWAVGLILIVCGLILRNDRRVASGARVVAI